MRRSTWQKLELDYVEFPDMRGPGASEEQIVAAETRLGCLFDRQYREFLKRYGSARVGSDPIYGVAPAPNLHADWSVIEMTEHFREQGWPGVDTWYVISIDGRGNPVGMDIRGQVCLSDHDVGDQPVIARSFEKYVLRQLKLSEGE